MEVIHRPPACDGGAKGTPVALVSELVRHRPNALAHWSPLVFHSWGEEVAMGRQDVNA